MSHIHDLAEKLKTELAPACVRIELAGSIRRSKVDPKDIEIVCIPRIEQQVQAGLFGVDVGLGEINDLEALVESLTDGAGEWEFDPITPRNGDRYKRLRHRETLVAVDLFITDARHWGAIYAIRTGPGDFGKVLVGHAHMLVMFVDEGLLHRHRRVYKHNPKTGKEEPQHCQRGEHCSLIIPTPEEEDFFAVLGVPCWPPAERSVMRLVKYLADRKRG